MEEQVQLRVFTIEEAQDTNDPFFIHLNESASLLLVSQLLNESNFHHWQQSMRMSLLTKSKLDFVDGSILELDLDDVAFPYWKRCNTHVLAWLIHAIEPTIAQSFLFLENAGSLWLELH